ncbi:MAG: glycosyl transferase family 4 [archaeon]|nr:glycosyl transferase family 4 [archaeon]
METILVIPLILSFFLTLLFIPLWIKKAKQVDLIWEDMNKSGKPKNVAGSGGLITILSFIFGVLTYISIKTFVLNTDSTTMEIFALLSSILIALLIGFVDDILGWVYGGISRRFRIALLFFSAIPLMVINAGNSEMLGINFGIIYPLIIIPLGIIGAGATFNFLAGYNGLETSQGIIILSALAIITYLTGNSWISLITLIMIASLIAFYIYNKYPAKVFPGDVLTYPLGVFIAIIAILGNIEKIAIFFFIPYIIEVILKSRGGLKKQSFAKVNEDGSLELPYDKIYGLEHLAIKILKKIKKNGKVYEKDVVYLINFFQILVVIAGFLIFRGNIF